LIRKRLFMYVGLMIVVAAAMSAVAFAGAAKTRFEAILNPIPHDMVADGGSNVTGRARLKVDGTQVHVNIHVRGLTPNLPHAMHIHGMLGDANVCPPASADTNGDGLVSLEEGAPFYGPIDASFTKTGDTSPASGLALERFPVADNEGNLNYNPYLHDPAERPRQPRLAAHRRARTGSRRQRLGPGRRLRHAVRSGAAGRLRHYLGQVVTTRQRIRLGVERWRPDENRIRL
jgi:hypothetical protein